MSRYLHCPAAVTDHSHKIAAMREAAWAITQAYRTGAPVEKRKDAAILLCAAALLETHDDAGLSLDNWIGPLELVHEALLLIGEPEESILPNEV